LTGRTARLLILPALLGAAIHLRAQARPTASRLADAQIGIGFSVAQPNYAPDNFRGLTAYAGLDLRPHLGAEFDFHQIDSPTADKSFQRTYEIGPRYFCTYGPLVPYLRVMYGRGVFAYPYDLTELSYNMFSAAAGADYKVRDALRLRLDYEYQTWTSFPNGGLHPQVLSFGVAWHVTGGPRYN
jgi:hypothetical protein